MTATHFKNIKLLKSKQSIDLSVTPGNFLSVARFYRIKVIAKLKSEVNGEKVMKPCQLGYICELTAEINTNKWGEKICGNQEACQEWSLSWGLPYTYNPEEKILTVEFKPTRYYWLKETVYRNNENILAPDCKIYEMKFGLSMVASERMISAYGGDELDIKEIIIRELTEAKWAEAVSIEMQPKISRDGITAIKPTLSRMIGRFRNLVTDKINAYQTPAKVNQTPPKVNPNTM